MWRSPYHTRCNSHCITGHTGVLLSSRELTEECLSRLFISDICRIVVVVVTLVCRLLFCQKPRLSTLHRCEKTPLRIVQICASCSPRGLSFARALLVVGLLELLISITRGSSRKQTNIQGCKDFYASRKCRDHGHVGGRLNLIENSSELMMDLKTRHKGSVATFLQDVTFAYIHLRRYFAQNVCSHLFLE